MNILIIGAGEIGKAIEKLIKTTSPNQEVEFWDKDDTKITSAKILSEAVINKDLIFLCIPSFAYVDVLAQIENNISENTIIISLAKGIINTGETIVEEFVKFPKIKNIAFLCGPMIAEEIISDKYSFANLACVNDEVLNKVSAVLKNNKFGVEKSEDIKGSVLAGPLKNIYAILFGACDAIGFGQNEKGILFKKAISEMSQIIKDQGGNPQTAISYAGLGDLFATATSINSKNHEIGKELILSGMLNLSGEGSASLDGLKIKLGGTINKYPVLDVIIKMTSDSQNAKNIINDLWK